MTTNPRPFPDPRLDADDELDLYDDDPGVPITLTAAQQADLVAMLNRALQVDGCDNTLRAARRWAEGAAVPWPLLQRELQANGGFCDCEILFNAFPDEDPGPEPERAR